MIKNIVRIVASCFIVLTQSGCKAGDSLYVVPFELYDDITIIKVRINNSDTLNFVFDSGTTTTILDSTTAQKIGLISAQKEKLLLSNDFIDMPLSKYKTLKAGNVTLKNRQVLLHHSFENYERITGIPVHGIIGMDFYGKYITKFDFDEQKLYFNETSMDSTGYSEIPLTIRYDIPYVKAKVYTSNDDSIPLTLLFDTGDMTAISLAEPFWKKYDLLSKSKNSYSGINRNSSQTTSPSYFASFDKIAFDRSYFSNAYVNLTSAKKGFFANDSISGTIGIDILKRFNIIFNHRDEKMYVKPNSKVNEPYRINTTGMRARLDKDKKQCLVEAVLNNSPAEQAGLKVGDILLSINGVTADIYNIPIIRTLTRSKPGTKLEYIINRNGEILTINLQCREFSDM